MNWGYVKDKGHSIPISRKLGRTRLRRISRQCVIHLSSQIGSRNISLQSYKLEKRARGKGRKK
ncbi:hypothetical protein N7517_010455 [Penicillium concentricum]|uniref:Uncharacterized protein n=1 Tax=Penicillium concentricum TaxID=293559 RepID=A0A9W9R948_9EURO|nr:uncharacterized protein N7517_010455 [Penicillium concentricum]KAJ5355846.1 hypothetical protein N7517_010455 [Penicillium concentricum]